MATQCSIAIFLLFAAVTVHGATNNIRAGSCGQASVSQRFNRIVGGVESRQNSVPFIVSLRIRGWHSCGGTLLRVSPNKEESDIIVTAAHCIGSEYPDIVAGAHFTNYEIAGEVSVPSVQMVTHYNYNRPRAYANDIAIIKLSKPIKFSPTIQPACLPAGRNDAPKDKQYGIVAGWGALKENQAGPDRLMQVAVPVIESRTCQQLEPNIDPESMLCAGFENGQKDACQGDSGGPFWVEGPNGYTLQGVVSWGSGCARPRAPGMYAKVANYVDWIQQQIRSLSSIRA